jgi:hypothetical protein
VTFVHTDILHWYFHFSGGKTSFRSVRPYIQISICRGPEFETGFNKFVIFVFLKNEKKKKIMTDFIPLRTDGLPYTWCIALHCTLCAFIAFMLHCIALRVIHCIALHYMQTERNVNGTACLLLNCAIGHVYYLPKVFCVSVCLVCLSSFFWFPLRTDEVRSVRTMIFHQVCHRSRLMYYLRSDLCFVLKMSLFFFERFPYGRTDLWLYATELKLNWNNDCLSIRDIRHTDFFTLIFPF